MPQLNPGGKFVFGRSVLRENGSLRLPPQAVEEYRITEEGQVILFTGSKSTGGFCVTRRGLLLPSKLGHILTDCSGLGDGSLPPARLLAYKGRSYCWLPISPEGELSLPQGLMEQLQLTPGLVLLAIRSSDIAFTMGARGPFWSGPGPIRGRSPPFEQKKRDGSPVSLFSLADDQALAAGASSWAGDMTCCA